MLLPVLGAALLLFSTLDVWYFVRGSVTFLRAFSLPRIRDVLAEQSVDGLVLTNDLDFMGHMNNSRYLRECDFARLHHYVRNGVLSASSRLGARMVIGASTVRYRRSLAFGEAFQIRTRVLGWDEKAFYLEQRFVSKRDGFVSAVAFFRQNVVRSSPARVLELVCGGEGEVPKQPEFPEELKLWMSFDAASSQALRAQSGLIEKKGGCGSPVGCVDARQDASPLTRRGCVRRKGQAAGHEEEHPADNVACGAETAHVCGQM